MIKKITTKFKKFISILVCAMMVSLTFPVNMLNSAAYAEDDITYAESQTTAVPCEDEDIELNGGDVLEAGSMSELQEKINKAQDGDTIKLTKEIEITRYDDFELHIQDKKITITSDDPGNKILRKYPATAGLLEIKGKNASVTFENIEIDGNGVDNSAMLISVSEGSLNIGQNATISRCIGFGTIQCDSGATVNINGGEISGCVSSNGSIIDCYAATVNINGGKIVLCTSLSERLICCQNGGNLNVNGGEISECKAKKGGAIYCGKNSILNVGGGKISGCCAEQGGAIYCEDGATVNITEGEIIECFNDSQNKNYNSQNFKGGAVFCDNGAILNINGGKISKCEANFGGAVYCYNSATVNVNEGEIFECEADFGGAVCCDYGTTANINGGKIYGCKAQNHGGAVYCYDKSSTVNINGGEIFECEAKEGGAIFCYSGTVTILGGEITYCKALYGGAIYNNEKLDMRGGNISACTATEKGDAVYCNTSGSLRLLPMELKLLTIKLPEEHASCMHNSPVSETLGYEGIYNEGSPATEYRGEEINLTLEQSNINDVCSWMKNALSEAKLNDIRIINIVLQDNISIDNNDIPAMCPTDAENIYLFDFTDARFKDKEIHINGATSESKLTIKNSNLFFLKARDCEVVLKNIQIDGGNTERKSAFIDVMHSISNSIKGTELNIGTDAVIKNCKSSGDDGGAIYNCGNMIINGGIITKCSSNNNGGAVYNYGAHLLMKKGCISYCEANGGGAIYNDQGIVNINESGEIQNCSGNKTDIPLAYVGGSAIYNKQGELNMNGKISECSSNSIGGAIYNDGNLNIEKGNIANCKAAYGGAIYNSRAFGNIKMIGGSVQNCIATIRGGAIYNDGHITVLGGEIINCTATEKGDAIYCGGSAYLNLPQKETGLLKIKLPEDHVYCVHNSSLSETLGYEGIFNNGIIAKQNAAYILPSDDSNNSGNAPVDSSKNNSNVNNNVDNKSDISNNVYVNNDYEVKNGAGGGSENIPNKYIEEADLDTIYEEEEKDADYDEDMLNEIENEPGEDEGEDHGYSDNDIGKYNGLKEFLEKDPGSEIVQLDEANGIVLTAKDGIIPPGYHFVAEKIQKDSNEWNDRIKDIDTRNLTNIEKMGIYDLSIQDENGIIFTLPEKFTVTVFIPCPDGYDINELQILHISSGIDDEFDETITTVNGQNYCTFKTTHFSPYAIIDEISKNDIFEMMAPWLIGAAVIAIGAVAVVIVLKNKNKSRA